MGDGNDNVGMTLPPAAADSVSLARARSEEKAEETRALGQRIAAKLASDDRCFQLEAALSVGINERRYYRLLEGDSAACEAFQEEVLPALYAQAKRLEEKAEQDIGSSANGSSAWGTWWKWKLEGRYRKLYGDLATQKVELTGKDGGPLESTSEVRVSRVLSKDVAREMAIKVLGVPEHLMPVRRSKEPAGDE